MNYRRMPMCFFVLCVLVSATMSSLAQWSKGTYKEELEVAAKFEKELREHGFTNVEVSAVGYGATNWRTQTHLYGPDDSNMSTLAELTLPDPYLYLHRTQVSDLSPLASMPLKQLFLLDAPNVSDRSLSVLRGAQMELIALIGTSVSDLSPLQGMQLLSIHLGASRVHDLRVLGPMPLVNCYLCSNRVSDISVLKGKQLRKVWLMEPAVTDISALDGAPLRLLDLRGARVRDLSPLRGAPLEEIFLAVDAVTNGIDILRGMETLEKINDVPAAEFWTKYDMESGDRRRQNGPEASKGGSADGKVLGEREK